MADAATTVSNPLPGANGGDPNAALFAAGGNNINNTAQAQIPPEDLAAFQKANPGLSFTNEDLAHYNAAQPNFNQINSTNTNPTTAVTLPGSQSSPQHDALASAAASTQPSLQKTLDSLQTAPTATDQKQQSILDSIAALTGQDTGKQAYQNQQETANGLPDLQKHLTDLNGQLLTGNAEYAKLVADNNIKSAALDSQGGISSAVVAAQQAGLTRSTQAQLAGKAADLALVAAQAQATSGQINTAISLAQKAVDAKYQPIEDGIKVQQAQLAAIQPLLDKEQKTQALAQQTFLDQQKQAVQDKKDKENQINTIALNAATAGATPDVIAAIQKSPDVLSAINAAAPALGAKVANDLKQQAFDNAIKLRTAANDAARVGIEQQNLNLNKAKLQQDNTNAAQAALNALVSTPSGKQYVNGANLDPAGKAAALNAGAVVLEGDNSKAMTSITNVQGSLGSLLSTLQTAGIIDQNGQFTGKNNTTGAFQRNWVAGDATPAVKNFGDNLKTMIADLQKLPGTGALVSTLQTNVLTGKENQQEMQTKISNIAQAIEDSENTLLVNNSKPTSLILNGQTLKLQADGTYQ